MKMKKVSLNRGVQHAELMHKNFCRMKYTTYSSIFVACFIENKIQQFKNMFSSY